MWLLDWLCSRGVEGRAALARAGVERGGWLGVTCEGVWGWCGLVMLAVLCKFCVVVVVVVVLC